MDTFYKFLQVRYFNNHIILGNNIEDNDDDDDDDHYDRAYSQEDNRHNTSPNARNENAKDKEVFLPIQNPYYSADNEASLSKSDDPSNADRIKITENPYYE